MASTYTTAVDSILATLKETWDTDTPALNGSAVVALVYEDTEKDAKPHPRETGAAWARVSVRHEGARAAAIGGRKYRRTGMVWVQVFVPHTDGLAKDKAQALAAVALKAYESARGSLVSFKDAAVIDKGPEGAWIRADCTARFWWDELR